MESRNQRKKLLIEKKFQMKSIWQYLLINMEIQLFMGIIIFFVLYRNFSSYPALAQQVDSIAGDIAVILVPVILFSIVVTSAAISYIVLTATNHIAGPIYRFNSGIQEMIQGRLKPSFIIRENDQFADTSSLLTTLSETLYNDLSSVKSSSSSMDCSHGNENRKAFDEIKSVLERYSF